MAENELSRRLAQLKVAARPKGPITFFSLPGEIRNEIYRYMVMNNVKEVRLAQIARLYGPRSQVTADIPVYDRDIRRDYVSNMLSPKIPTILQTSKRIREESVAFFKTQYTLKCTNYRGFRGWAQGIGLSIVPALNEIRLRLPVHVKLAQRGYGLSPGTREPQRKLCTLRVWFRKRDEGPRWYGPFSDHPVASFWFEILDDNDGHSNERAYIKAEELTRLSNELTRRLDPGTHLDAVGFLRLVAWIIVADVNFNASEESESWRPNSYTHNSMQIVESGSKRSMVATTYPPGTCDGCTSSTVWLVTPFSTSSFAWRGELTTSTREGGPGRWTGSGLGRASTSSRGVGSGRGRGA